MLSGSQISPHSWSGVRTQNDLGPNMTGLSCSFRRDAICWYAFHHLHRSEVAFGLPARSNPINARRHGLACYSSFLFVCPGSFANCDLFAWWRFGNSIYVKASKKLELNPSAWEDRPPNVTRLGLGTNISSERDNRLQLFEDLKRFVFSPESWGDLR